MKPKEAAALLKGLITDVEAWDDPDDNLLASLKEAFVIATRVTVPGVTWLETSNLFRAAVPSESRPDKHHMVTAQYLSQGNEAVSCTCENFVYVISRQNTLGGRCKHMRAVEKKSPEVVWPA